MDGVFPGAMWRPVRFTGETGFVSADLRGWLLHVAEMNGSPWHVFDSSPPGARKVSTGWVGKDGRVEQYLTTAQKPWAQQDGNTDWLAFETEGYATEPLTADQIYSLGAIHAWLGTPDIVATSPAGRGIGTHQMGGQAWGGHACPGPARAAQRPDIISAAQQMRRGQEMALTKDELRKIADAVQTTYQVHSPNDGGALVTRDAALGAMWALMVKQDAQIDALTADLNALTAAAGKALGGGK